MTDKSSIPIKLRPPKPQHQILRIKCLCVRHLKNCVCLRHQAFIQRVKQSNANFIATPRRIRDVGKLISLYNSVRGEISSNSIGDRLNEGLRNRNTKKIFLLAAEISDVNLLNIGTDRSIC